MAGISHNPGLRVRLLQQSAFVDGTRAEQRLGAGSARCWHPHPAEIDEADNNQILPTRPVLPPQPVRRSARWPHLHPMPGGRSGTLADPTRPAEERPSRGGPEASATVNQTRRRPQTPLPTLDLLPGSRSTWARTSTTEMLLGHAPPDAEPMSRDTPARPTRSSSVMTGAVQATLSRSTKPILIAHGILSQRPTARPCIPSSISVASSPISNQTTARREEQRDGDLSY